MRTWNLGVLGILTLVGSLSVAGFASHGLSAPQEPPPDHITTVHVSNCQQPPANLNPDTVTAAELEAYGLPPRPLGAQGLPFWRSMIAHSLHRECVVQRHTNPKSQGIQRFTSATRVNSGVWAGNADINGNNIYDGVEGYFNFPPATGPNSSEVSAWTGLGGAGCGDSIIQSGADITIDSTGQATRELWLENYPQGAFTITGDIKANDSLLSYNNNINQDYAYVCDSRSNIYFSSTNVPGFDTTYHSSTLCSADWIVEGNLRGNSVANFGQINFSSGYAFTIYTQQFSIGQQDHDYFVLCTGGLGTCGWWSTQQAHPGPLSSDGTSFPVIFDHS